MDIEDQLNRDTHDLIGPADPKPTARTALTRHLAAELSTNHVDLPLLACCLCSGLTDSTLYNAYSTFVSMQTGNTIFVALGASHQNAKPYGWARSLTSIACFAFGSLFFSRLTAALGPHRRRSLVLSFALQTLLVLLAAALISAGVIDGAVPQRGEVGWDALAPIALLSFQAAAQVVASRALGVGEVPTVVVTSLLADLMGDRGLMEAWGANVKRNQRVAAFGLTLVGAIAGGWISKGTGGVEGALWVVAGVKAGIVVGWMGWREREREV